MSQRELVAIEAEQGVIGALMVKPELCEEVGAFLSAKDFSDADRGMVYTTVLACHSKGVKPDPITMAEMCPYVPGGDSMIYAAGMIANNFPSAANGVHYGRIVAERAAARRLLMAGQMIMDLAREHGSLPAQIAKAQQALFDLTVEEETPDVVSYHDVLATVCDEIDERYRGTVEIGLEFGLPDLDALTNGLRPGNLVIIAGKPGTGKTVLGTNLADKVATQDGKSALIFSLEMPSAELVKRAIAAAGGIPKDWIDSGGKHDDNNWPRLTSAVSQLSKADVRLCDKGSLTFSRLCNIARFQHRAKPLHLIVVDYLTLIRSDKDARFGTRSQEVGAISRGLKALAKELNIPVVALAQLNRAADGRAVVDSMPRMSDLRDSGEIEQDADIIILGHRADDPPGRSGITTWLVPKVRHGRPGQCALQFQGEFQRFVSVAESDAYAYERMTGSMKAPKRDFEPGFD